jgi:hypothetical protein
MDWISAKGGQAGSRPGMTVTKNAPQNAERFLGAENLIVI